MYMEKAVPRPNYPDNLDFLIASFSSINLDHPDQSDVITETDGTLTEFNGLEGIFTETKPGLTMTFAFASFENSGLELVDADPNLFRPMAENLRDIIRETLEEISRILDITFVETDSGSAGLGDLHFEIVGTGGAGGQFIPNLEPVTGNPAGTGGFIHLGIADFSTDGSRSSLLADDEQFNDGTFPLFKAVFIHEFAHALGLRHPESDNAEEAFFEVTGEQVDASFFQSLTRLPDEFNTVQFTSVGARAFGFSEPPVLQQISDAGGNFYTDLATFGLLDILALQRLYGANETATAGNDVYIFKSEQALYQAIFDAGGIDTFSFQNQIRGVVADIREGAFSSAGLLETNPGGFLPDPQPEILAESNIAVAFNTVIENVIGSDFADNIRGNLVNNKLTGNGGDDTIDGDDGNDRLLGGDGDDMLAGGTGNDTLVGGAGSDKAEGGVDNDTFFAGAGDTSGDMVSGGAGNDVVAVGDGDDLAVGDDAVAQGFQATTTDADGSDTIFGGAGSDTLHGGAGDDLFYGGKGTSDNEDVFTGGSGADIFFGGTGNDGITADAGDDQLFGGAGDDTLDGGAGADSLFGGGADDNITTGTGADALFFANDHGDDTVTDFDASEDTLFLTNTVTDFTDLTSVQAAASATTVGGVTGLLIDTGGGNSVFLQGMSSSDLSASNLAL